MTTETEARLTEALTQITARLDALEKKIDGLQGGGGAALPADVSSGLARIAGRIETIERALDVADNLGRSTPAIMDAVGSVAGQALEQLEAEGVDLAELADAGRSLALRGADPEALRLLETLLSRKDLLRAMVDGADEIERALADAGTDLPTFVRKGAGVTGRLAGLMNTPEFEAFVGRSGALEPTTLSVVGDASKALVDTRSEPVQPVGLFGALKAMGDPDVQRAVGFALAIARRFGSAIS